MLKLNASFSKKVPVPGADFSSQSFHAAVEVELPDGLTPEQLQSRIHQTFTLVRDSVEGELRNGHSVAPAAASPQPANPPAAQNQGGQANSNGQQKATIKASPPQIKFLTDLGVRHRIDLKGLNALATQAFKVPAVGDLSRKQASSFIDNFDEIARTAERVAA
jgi:hypothetical protein